MVTRKVRFSKEVRSRLTDAEKKKIARWFANAFKKSGRQFLEKYIGDDCDVLYCDVTPKLFRVMMESEW